jgi:hypothetical protein
MKETMTTGEALTKQWLLKKGIKRKTNDGADDEGSQTYSKFTTKRPRCWLRFVDYGHCRDLDIWVF